MAQSVADSPKRGYLVSNTNMHTNAADSLYFGGNGDGFNQNLQTGLNLLIAGMDSLYRGGNGDGFHQNLQTGLNFSIPITDSFFHGGSGDGFNQSFQTGLNLTNPVTTIDSLFHGSNGKGEAQLWTTVNLGPCNIDTVIWKGNTNTAWSNIGNWDCGVVPGVNSVVIIPSGLSRYPVLSTTREIKKLILKPGANFTLIAGAFLILNGQ